MIIKSEPVICCCGHLTSNDEMRFIKQTKKQIKETRFVSNKFEDMLKSMNITI